MSKRFKKSRGTKTKIGRNKKYEGYSQIKQSQVTNKGKVSQNFSQHLSKLQKKADENVEDEYIQSLQEEIKFLEMELKLLKDKEYEQQASLNEVDKYFTDGCNVNENILGIKSRYNKQDKAFKTQLQKLKDDLQDEQEAKAELENEIKMLKSKADDLTSEFKKAENDLNDKIDKFKEGTIRENHTQAIMELELKKKSAELKDKLKINLQNRRKLEREEITKEKRWEEQGNDKKKHLKKKKENEDYIKMYQTEIDQLTLKADFDREQLRIEKENVKLQKQINVCESEFNVLGSKINDLELALEIKQAEREKEDKRKRDILDEINDIKHNIDKENSLNEQMIQEKVKEQEKKDIKQLQKQIDEMDQKIIDRTDYIDITDQNIDTMSEQKVKLNQEQYDANEKMRILISELEENRGKLLDSRVKKDFLNYLNVKLNPKIKPLLNQIHNIKDLQIPQLEEENQELVEKCAKYETLRELSEELQKFNVEEMLIIKKTNEQINEKVIELDKQWGSIQSNFAAKQKQFGRKKDLYEFQKPQY